MQPISVIFKGETAAAIRALKGLRSEEAQVATQTKELGGSANRSKGELDRLGRGAVAGSGVMKGFGRQIAYASSAFLGAYGFIAVVRKAFDAAKDLQIQQSRSQIVFGDSGRAIRTWAASASRDLALVNTDTLTAANSFGTMLTAMKVSPAVAAGLSKEMTKVAAAISLVRGEADPTEAVQAINSGLSGRGTALRQYGIVLDQVSIKAEAVRLGLVHASVDSAKVREAQLALNIEEAKYADALQRHGKNSTQAASAELSLERAHGQLAKTLAGGNIQLTHQQQAQAAANLVLQQGAHYVDNYGKLLHTTAGQQRVFHSGVADLEEELGRQLIPAFNAVLGKINPYLRSLEEGGSRHAEFVRT